MDGFEMMGDLAATSGGIAVAVGVLWYALRRALPPLASNWLFEQRPWLVNLGVVASSIGVAFLGAWLNLVVLDGRSAVELAWLGLCSAATATLGYEFLSNWRAEP